MIDLLLTPTTWESARIVAACILAFAGFWGLIHAEDGFLVLVTQMRESEVARRRWLMIVFVAIALLFGGQGIVAVGTPDPQGGMTGQLVMGNFAILGALVGLAVMTFYLTAGWADAEELAPTEPLNPTLAELLEETSKTGRVLMHASLNDLTVVVNALDLIDQAGGLSPEQELDMEQALIALQQLHGRLTLAQQLARGLGPTDGHGHPMLEPHDAPR